VRHRLAGPRAGTSGASAGAGAAPHAASAAALDPQPCRLSCASRTGRALAALPGQLPLGPGGPRRGEAGDTPVICQVLHRRGDAQGRPWDSAFEGGHQQQGDEGSEPGSVVGTQGSPTRCGGLPRSGGRSARASGWICCGFEQGVVIAEALARNSELPVAVDGNTEQDCNLTAGGPCSVSVRAEEPPGGRRLVSPGQGRPEWSGCHW
jgi:hypothetical protein